MKYYFYYLTAAIILFLVLVSLLIKVPFPQSPSYLVYTMEDPFQVLDLKKHLRQYEQLKIDIQTRQFQLSRYYKIGNEANRSKIREEARQYLFRSIIDDIIPYWLQTEWDFNGTTETPRKGQIACGYFVTTVLKHAGIELDKYYLSRASSATLIKHLCQPQHITTIRENDYTKFLAHLQTQPDGIYIVGLDTHVGLIEKSDKNLFFIHSRKPRSAGVIKEKVLDSKTLKKSKIYVVGNLLDNESIIKNWLKHT
ncbi:MAG: hypothetical protein MUE85_23105 [Microscillaceae bacterium]|nr:hypothetical protein [Microscillaceae bacterium]